MITKCVVCLQPCPIYSRVCKPCMEQGISIEQAMNLVVERRGMCSDRELVAALSHATSVRKGWSAHVFRVWMRKELYEKLGGRFD